MKLSILTLKTSPQALVGVVNTFFVVEKVILSLFVNFIIPYAPSPLLACAHDTEHWEF